MHDLQRITKELAAVLGDGCTDAIAAYIDFLECNASPSEVTRVHKHHALPRVCFPKFSNVTEHPWNIIPLSIEAHQEAHRLLIAIFPTHRRIAGAYALLTRFKFSRFCESRRVPVHRFGDEKWVFPESLAALVQEGWVSGRRLGHHWVFRKRHTSLLIGRGNTLPKPWAPDNSPSTHRWFNNGVIECFIGPSDPRRLTYTPGRTHSAAAGKVWINDGLHECYSFPEEIPPGYVLGRLQVNNTGGRIWINKDGHGKVVPPEDVEHWTTQGYSRGMPEVDRSHVVGTSLYNNGLIELQIKVTEFSEEAYPGFQRGRLPTNVKSAVRVGAKWFNNGVAEVQTAAGGTPPEGYIPGRIFRHRKRKLGSGRRLPFAVNE